MIQTYYRQNKVQEKLSKFGNEAVSVYRIFKPTPCGLATYVPKFNKFKIAISFLITGISIPIPGVTPFIFGYSVRWVFR